MNRWILWHNVVGVHIFAWVQSVWLSDKIGMSFILLTFIADIAGLFVICMLCLIRGEETNNK